MLERPRGQQTWPFEQSALPVQYDNVTMHGGTTCG